MRFECVDGWNVKDGNVTDNEGQQETSIFSGSMALMQPQDMRQYIYILTPKTPKFFPVIHSPGSIIPLGRLDISWRSSFGEPGRLLTSMLSRRIPLPPAPVQQPASALPSYLKRHAGSSSTASPSRPRSPQLPQSRPGSPTPRPGSPFRNRPASAGAGPIRPQTPPALPIPPPIPEIEPTLVVRNISRDSISIREPFTIAFSLGVSSSVPASSVHPTRRRTLTLAVQHLQPPRITVPAPLLLGQAPDTFSPRINSPGFSTPSPLSTTFNYALAHQKLLGEAAKANNHEESPLLLPPPFFQGHDELKSTKSAVGVVFSGPSTVFLPTVELVPEPGESGTTEQTEEERGMEKVQAIQDFELTYMPLVKGFTTVGGLRVLLVDDKYVGDGDFSEDDVHDEKLRRREVKILKEWDVIGEIWVSS